ncbi:MAG: hypothetical protein R3Y28_01895 [Candidatus Gastranaerophilales bacterium]
MSKHILKSIAKIIEDNGSDKITLFTENLKIDGSVFMPSGRCEECHNDYLVLENALVCRLNDYCECDENGCECKDYVCFRYDWLNVNIGEIVAFSIIND